MNYELQIKKHRNSGYTIIETMIAISLFLVVVMSGMGALLNANLLHQKSSNLRSIMDNLSFIMEDMSRNLRTGYNYRCYSAAGSITGDAGISTPNSCESGWGIAFETGTGLTTTNADQWAYYIDNTGIIYKSTDGAASFIKLTPEEVVINTAASGFSVLGAESIATNKQQPFVTIRLVGKITYKGVDTPFSLQTSVSERLIDI